MDIINGATNSVIAQVGGFAGQQATTSVSGPDGVLVVNNGSTATLYAGDGGSILRSFNVSSPSAPVTQGTVNTGGPPFRVDEMSYSPSLNELFVANNANSPSFATLINATPPNPTVALRNIQIANQVPSGGMEQSVWDPNTNTFFVSVPTFNGTDAGGVQEFSSTGLPIQAFNFSAQFGIGACSPAGLTLGASGNLMVGCGTAGTQTVVLNPTGTGSIVATLSAVSGSDELWYDAANGNDYITGVNATGDRVIDVVSDANYALLQSIDLTSLGADHVNAHSVAVDPLNDEIFVPLEATTPGSPNALCANGCVAVFSQSVPEPASLPLLAMALAGIVGVGRMVRRGS
ncbi:MAG: hypothetical protein JO326_06345 [Acetobacteraceae bacterium]|nr:hypothetical protein [Acetobacteraceae bacterium]